MKPTWRQRWIDWWMDWHHPRRERVWTALGRPGGHS